MGYTLLKLSLSTFLLLVNTLIVYYFSTFVTIFDGNKNLIETVLFTYSLTHFIHSFLAIETQNSKHLFRKCGEQKGSFSIRFITTSAFGKIIIAKNNALLKTRHKIYFFSKVKKSTMVI